MNLSMSLFNKVSKYLVLRTYIRRDIITNCQVVLFGFINNI